MEIKGYKAFDSNMTNRYGIPFDEGETYTINDALRVKFGNDGTGFHFCERLEDTLRYFPAMEEEIRIAEVTGYGDIVTFEDDYFGFYDMHASSGIRIDKILDRREIIEMFLDPKCHEFRVNRFLSLFKLTNPEIGEFLSKRKDVRDIYKVIRYYQMNDKNAFREDSNIKYKELIKK